MVDRRLDDGGVHPHLLAPGHPGRRRDGHQAVQQLAQCRAVHDLTQSDHSLGVRDLARVDPAETPVHEAPGHLPLQLVVAPVAQVLERQHPQYHLGGRPRATSYRALPPPPAHHHHHGLDDVLILERLVDLPEPCLHEPFRLWQHQTEQHHLRQLELGVSSSDHASFDHGPAHLSIPGPRIFVGPLSLTLSPPSGERGPETLVGTWPRRPQHGDPAPIRALSAPPCS